MKKQYQSSLWDRLLDLLPEHLRSDMYKANPDYISPSIAKTLFSIWRTGENRIDEKTYRRPDTLAHDDIEKMKEAGLIKAIGNKIEITDKGSKVIKIMILGDERSSFDDNELIIDYNKALTNTKGVKTAKKNKFK